jgi:orotate phosphoribosyltransferase
VFSERKDGQMMIRRGFSLEQGEKVVIAEDVVTRGTSLLEVVKVVEEAGGVVVGLTSIIDRTGGDVELPLPLKSLAKVKVETWDAAACPLCQDGIDLIKPGSRGN